MVIWFVMCFGWLTTKSVPNELLRSGVNIKLIATIV